MRIHTLDSLRGIFALMVVLLHFPADWHLLHHPLVRNDGISVDFFFVLSGFVVSLAYADAIKDGHDLAGFLIRRLGRIWPLHVVVLAMFLCLDVLRWIASQQGLASDDAFFGQPQYWPVFLQDLFFLNAFRDEPSFHLNFPAWSIGAEFWTYVIFGILALLVRPLWMAAGVVMAGCLLVMTGVFDPGFGQAFGWALFRSVFFFLSGYFTFRLWQKLKGKTLPLAGLAEGACVLLVVLAILYRRELPLPPVIFALVFAMSILTFAFQAGPVSRLLLTRPMQVIGERSYSIYLLHILILGVTGVAFRLTQKASGLTFYIPGQVGGEPIDLLSIGGRFGTDLAVLAMLALIIWVSGITYRLIELPGQRIASRLARRLAGQPVGT